MTALDSNRPPDEAIQVVEDSAQAEILTDAKQLDLLVPFLGREKSVGQAAIEAGCKLNRMHYYVNKFRDAGLLLLARQQPRKGRAVKYYRSKSDALFIPHDLMRYADSEERLVASLLPALEQVGKGVAQEESARGTAGQCVFRNARGDVYNLRCTRLHGGRGFAFPAADPALGRHAGRSGYVWLTEDEARRMREELWSLVDRYMAARIADPDRRRRCYAYLYAMAPAPRPIATHEAGDR